jgi:hypothetical protein
MAKTTPNGDCLFKRARVSSLKPSRKATSGRHTVVYAGNEGCVKYELCCRYNSSQLPRPLRGSPGIFSGCHVGNGWGRDKHWASGIREVISLANYRLIPSTKANTATALNTFGRYYARDAVIGPQDVMIWTLISRVIRYLMR